MGSETFGQSVSTNKSGVKSEPPRNFLKCRTEPLTSEKKGGDQERLLLAGLEHRRVRRRILNVVQWCCHNNVHVGEIEYPADKHQMARPDPGSCVPIMGWR